MATRGPLRCSVVFLSRDSFSLAPLLTPSPSAVAGCCIRSGRGREVGCPGLARRPRVVRSPVAALPALPPLLSWRAPLARAVPVAWVASLWGFRSGFLSGRSFLGGGLPSAGPGSSLGSPFSGRLSRCFLLFVLESLLLDYVRKELFDLCRDNWPRL